ncbi:hypothetical protein OF83DRAFT_1170117 [Amylostereum chailletii]|nr:hypothetical protein OF83DRAFT_1170117 [Amylostereum chailletii]
MCMFCGQGSHGAIAAKPQGKTFEDLRISQADYERLTAGRESSHSALSFGDRLASGPHGRAMKVSGFSDDVKAVLQAASGINGQDYVEVQWSDMDSVLFVMQRLEKVVRVPMRFWYHWCSLVEVSFTLQGISSEAWNILDVTLIASWDVEEFASQNLKTHTWKHNPPVIPDVLPTNPREKAQVLFNMIDPTDSPYWPDYITHRQKADEIMEDSMEGMYGEDDLKDNEAETIADGVCVMMSDVTDSGGDGDGWRPFGWFYLDDRRADHSQCPVTRRDLQIVHDALFGPALPGTLGERVSLRTTDKLLITNVGIPFEIAENEEDDDGHLGHFGDEAFFEIDAQKPGLSAAHLRKILGMEALEKDDKADLTKVQVGEAMDDGDDEDYDSDDDMGGRRGGWW